MQQRLQTYASHGEPEMFGGCGGAGSMPNVQLTKFRCAGAESAGRASGLVGAGRGGLGLRDPRGEPEVCEGCGGAGGVRCFACDGTGVMATSDAELDMSPEAQRRAQKVGS